MPTSISGISSATICRGCATSHRSRSATATTRALRRSYLPRDYFRDAAGHHVVKTVYVETEWDPSDFVGETRWLQKIIAETGYPHAIVAGRPAR